MNFERITQVWATQGKEDVVIADEPALLKQIETRYKKWSRALTWLTFQEGVPSMALTFFFTYLGLREEAGAWVFFVMAHISLASAVFFFATTLKQRFREKAYEDSLKGELQRSLDQVNHYVWLLGKCMWWQGLPLIAIAGLWMYWKGFIEGSVDDTANLQKLAGLFLLFLAMIYGFVRMNLWQVRKNHLPRKKALEDLLESIE